MLRPTEGITNRGGPLRTRCSSERMRDLVKKISVNAANFLHHLGGVTREMPPQFLKDALRILQREIALWATQVAAFVKPTVTFVSPLLFIPPREISVTVVLRVTIFVRQNAGGIRVMNDVFAKVQLVLNQMIDKSA